MKQVNEIPSVGQFLLVWEYKGKPWSKVARCSEGEYEEYSEGVDSWRKLYKQGDIEYAYYILSEPVERPLIGLIPEYFHNSKRTVAICQAMERYAEHGKSIPAEWLDELGRLNV